MPQLKLHMRRFRLQMRHPKPPPALANQRPRRLCTISGHSGPRQAPIRNRPDQNKNNQPPGPLRWPRATEDTEKNQKTQAQRQSQQKTKD